MNSSSLRGPVPGVCFINSARCRWKVFLGCFFTVAVSAIAQTVALPNPDFEQGDGKTPTGWALTEGTGSWLVDDVSKSRCVEVYGTGADSNRWHSDVIAFEPSAVYRMKADIRGIDAKDGTALLGAMFANRDVGEPDTTWKPNYVIFQTPFETKPEMASIAVGQWNVKGRIAFDNVELVRVQPLYTMTYGIALGDGETIEHNEYAFDPDLWRGNHSRCLESHRCIFNTNRWVFTPDSIVTYAHSIPARQFSKASVRITLQEYQHGELSVQASVKENEWKEIGAISENGEKSFDLPAELLPADRLRIQLSARPKAGVEGAPEFQISGYSFHGALTGDPVNVVGATRYLAIAQADPRLQVNVTSLGDLVPGDGQALTIQVRNVTADPITAAATVTMTRKGDQPMAFTTAAQLKPGDQEVRVPYSLIQSGDYTMKFEMGPGIQYRTEMSFHVATLYESSYGQRLPGSNDAVALWWASSGWKVGRTRPAPSAAGDALTIRAARNEVEAAQLVLRPVADLHGLKVVSGSLNGPGGAFIPHENVDVLNVQYVNIARPTDSAGCIGAWPDPLPPLDAPINLGAGVNQPFWVRVHVPAGIPAGVYSGVIHMTSDSFNADTPIRVEVYDFDLPARMTCVTSFGFSPELIFQYQKITDPAQRRQVLDKYLRDYSAHHIAPYNPAPMDPFTVTWPGIDAYKTGQSKDVAASFTPKIDWAAWDAAMKIAIDQYGFRTFSIPIEGMGGGTFHSRVEPIIQGFAENTPEYKAAFSSYCKQVEDHLRTNGWLDNAYVYWFDEPDPKDYEFVMNGFRKIKEAAPAINRMLTEQVEPALVGGPNIWCPISNAFDIAAAEERRKAGDKFWWYICTGPKTPYCGEFIDHPGVELRTWLWQTWQRKIGGILIWQSNYWNSDVAYPDHASPQNPYTDPMSWTSGYDTPPGSRIPWGNGDGRFVYPPELAADGKQAQTSLDGPIDSVRWEMLRDGIEDYEYLAMLQKRIAEAQAAGATAESLAPLIALLEVPTEISETATKFNSDPAAIESRRDAIARAIVSLNKK